MMVAGTIGIIIGGPVAFLIFQGALPPEAWKAFAALSGSWIGGSANFVAIAESVGAPDAVLGPAIVVDTVVGYSWMAVLLALSAWQLRFDRAIGARRTGSLGRALLVAVAVGTAYTLIGVSAAQLTDGRGTEISTGRAAWHFLALGVTGALLGALRGTGAVSTLARRLPPALRHGIRTGLVAAFLVVGAGAGGKGILSTA